MQSLSWLASVSLKTMTANSTFGGFKKFMSKKLNKIQGDIDLKDNKFSQPLVSFRH